MVQRQALVSVDSESRTTMTTIDQPSHLVNRVERAFKVISDREKIVPFEEEKQEVIEAIKEKKSFETDDILLLGVIAFLFNEGFMDKTFLSSLFWIFMG